MQPTDRRETLPRDLGDGLTLRRAMEVDTDALVALILAVSIREKDAYTERQCRG